MDIIGFKRRTKRVIRKAKELKKITNFWIEEFNQNKDSIVEETQKDSELEALRSEMEEAFKDLSIIE